MPIFGVARPPLAAVVGSEATSREALPLDTIPTHRTGLVAITLEGRPLVETAAIGAANNGYETAPGVQITDAGRTILVGGAITRRLEATPAVEAGSVGATGGVDLALSNVADGAQTDLLKPTTAVSFTRGGNDAAMGSASQPRGAFITRLALDMGRVTTRQDDPEE